MKTECPAICMKQSAHIFIVYSCLVVENFNLLIKCYIPRGYKIDCATEWYMYIHSISCANTRLQFLTKVYMLKAIYGYIYTTVFDYSIQVI